MQEPIYAFFSDMAQARRAIGRVEASGVAQSAISTYTVVPSSSGHAGSFADSGAHQHTPERDHVGSFADSGPHQHTPERDHVGSFADSGPHQHTPARDHVGSFADTDRGTSHLRHLARELAAAGMTDEAAGAAAERVGAGAVMVLVRATDEQRAPVAAALEA